MNAHLGFYLGFWVRIHFYIIKKENYKLKSYIYNLFSCDMHYLIGDEDKINIHKILCQIQLSFFFQMNDVFFKQF